MNNIKIRNGSFEEIQRISKEIPEFTDNYSIEDYQKRIGNKPQQALIASVDNQFVGFKLGYISGDHFYSWLGGVIPDYRKKGIAKLLAAEQEKWVRKHDIEKIRFKTLNRFKGMLIFALKNGYQIKGTEPFEQENTIKIILEKQLK